MLNYADRSLFGLMIPLIKQDLHLSDTILGLISGVLFATVYTTLLIPVASIADRKSRRNIVGIGFGFWSLMTFLSGAVTSAWQLAFSRLFMAAGEAAGLAPSQSMVADIVAKERRPLALSVLTSGSSLYAIVLLPMLAIAADRFGWRVSFYIAGAVGMILAVLFFLTVREPQRDAPIKERVPIFQAMMVLRKSMPYLAMMISATLMGGVMYSRSAWEASFLVRVHDLSIAEVGVYVAPVRGILGAAGALGAGYLAERLGRRDPKWRLWVPALCCVAFVPAHLAYLLSDTREVWIAGLALSSMFVVAYQGPMFAAVVAIAEPRMRAVAISIIFFCSGLLGQLCGPFVVGILNDTLLPIYGPKGIRYSLLLMTVCGAAASVPFFVAPFFGRTRETPTD
jgi:MFS family permease